MVAAALARFGIGLAAGVIGVAIIRHHGFQMFAKMNKAVERGRREERLRALHRLRWAGWLQGLAGVFLVTHVQRVAGAQGLGHHHRVAEVEVEAAVFLRVLQPQQAQVAELLEDLVAGKALGRLPLAVGRARNDAALELRAPRPPLCSPR